MEYSMVLLLIHIAQAYCTIFIGTKLCFHIETAAVFHSQVTNSKLTFEVRVKQINISLLKSIRRIKIEIGCGSFVERSFEWVWMATRHWFSWIEQMPNGIFTFIPNGFNKNEFVFRKCRCWTHESGYWFSVDICHNHMPSKWKVSWFAGDTTTTTNRRFAIHLNCVHWMFEWNFHKWKIPVQMSVCSFKGHTPI